MRTAGLTAQIRRISDLPAVSGTAWTLLGFGGGRVVRMVSRLVLTRLLDPATMGLWAIVSAVLAGLQLFSDLGVGQSIIQHPQGETDRFRATAFALQVVRGLALSVVCVAAAFPVATFYGQPTLVPVLAVAALSPAISGFSSMSLWLLNRQMQLRPTMLLQLGAGVTGAAVGVGWAWFQPSVWALVAENLVGVLLTTAGSHFLTKRRDRFAWDRDAARSLLTFGAGMLLSSATAFIATQGENLLLAKVLDLATIGVLSIPLMLVGTFEMIVGRITSSVVFPMLSQAFRAGTDAAVRQFRTGRLIMLGASLLGLLLIVPGGLVLDALLDERYADAGWMFQILSLRLILRLSSSPSWSLFLAAGYMRYAYLGNPMRLGFMVAGVLIAVQRGDMALVCWALALAPLPDYLNKIWGLARHYPTLLRYELACAALTAAGAGALYALIGR